ncbi:PLP-dependent aminotransferase family protein [Aeromicrobium sp.]|uniref:MocR-like transcription factor YczR n=1 Tax=Aeromicrobium sp. TaxID=1871063 RepID=UPI003D6A0F59
MSATLSAARLAAALTPPVGVAYRDLADQIRMLIVDGRITAGSRLPSERELAAATGVSRTTTARVYAELREAGLLRSRRGSGSVVCVPFGESSASSLIVTPADDTGIALTYAAPVAPSGLGRAFEAATARLPGLLSTPGYLPDGLPALRELLAERYAARGLPTSPDQIVVTSGALSAVSLVARAFVEQGDRVLVESVSYPHAHEAFVSAGARLMPVPVVADGPWDVEAAVAMLSSGRHLAAYLIPDFHNPTAAVMSESERGTLARAMRQTGTLAVIDESMRDVNLDGVALPPSFGSFDRDTLLVDSASKTIWGGLRVGWIRAPHDLVMPLVQARMMHDLGTAAFEQLVLAEVLRDPEPVMTSALDGFRSQRDHLVALLAEHLPELDVARPAGGLSVWAGLPDHNSTRLVAAARDHGLLLTPGPRFFTGAPIAGEAFLRLPYTQSPAVLDDAVHRLAKAYEGRRADHAPAGPRLDLIA